MSEHSSFMKQDKEKKKLSKSKSSKEMEHAMKMQKRQMK